MRAIWKGAITFGLVNVPVKVYSATEDHDVPLHQVHDKDGGRIRYRRVCEIDGEVVPYEHIDKAYDDGERTVVLTSEDFAALPAERSREIEVVEFVPSEQIDPLLLDRSYYLEPDSKSNKAYVLMRRTLEETDRTAIVKFALRQRTRLAALRVRDDVLVLQTLLWADEVREAAFPSLDDEARVTDKELAMSAQLVASFEADFTPRSTRTTTRRSSASSSRRSSSRATRSTPPRRSASSPRRARAPRSSTSWRRCASRSRRRRARVRAGEGLGFRFRFRFRFRIPVRVDGEVRLRPRERVVGEGLERLPVDEREQELGREGEVAVEAGREEEHEPRRLLEGEGDDLEDHPEEGVRLGPGHGRARTARPAPRWTRAGAR